MGGKIALAGASTGLGASFVDALVEKNVTDFVVLSRKTSEDVRKIAVDYNDVESLQRVLEEHQIETVVSTIAIDTDDSGQAQMNLIAAAEQASCTKRFIPSDQLDFAPVFRWKFKAKAALEASNLEYTIPTRLTRAPPMLLDLACRVATVPGDGNTPMVLTHTRDVARYTVALLGIPKWVTTRYTIIANRLTLNEAVKMAEEILGEPIKVYYDSVEDLAQGKVTMTPTYEKAIKGTPREKPVTYAVAMASLYIHNGHNDLPTEHNLVNMFPDIKPLTVREVIEAWR
ncbi:hypothetical protein PoMZ_12612 [Pyricularia oryzae]|uniref:NmrA-like domain-containing protein n=1 Tax=Pyricularia oryzae TaxID=318829 RepID=A0A4P7NTF4_PYROR|nr:hypothetical protein PoMZ_12612 [Pyricularia oryzae]